MGTGSHNWRIVMMLYLLVVVTLGANPTMSNAGAFASARDCNTVSATMNNQFQGKLMSKCVAIPDGNAWWKP